MSSPAADFCGCVSKSECGSAGGVGWGWGTAQETRAGHFVCWAAGGVKWEQCHLQCVTL